jgi:antitoxin HicB
VYPINLIPQEEGNRNLLVKFPDVPEALTEGATREEALTEARDALLAVLGGYINDRRAVTTPGGASSANARTKVKAGFWSVMWLTPSYIT